MTRLNRAEAGVEFGTVVAGRYKVLDEIGRGGMGIVYRVEHVRTGEPLALKLLVGAACSDPLAVKRFKREGRTSARIQSEHVVHVSDADRAPEIDGSPFLVMELLSGMDVETYVTRNGPLEPVQLVALLAQVASVLETAHGLGIVHRDLKPKNLFLHRRRDGSTIAKVLDFGISKFALEEQAVDTANTATGSVLGTPLYMAPEQAHGQNDKIAPTTDVWALGLIAMRLLTGEHYWGAPTMADLMMKIAVLPILPPSERWPNAKHMSPALDRWFLRSCNRDQAMRWPTVALQLGELASVFGLDLPAPGSRGLTLSSSPIAPNRAIEPTPASDTADTESQTLSPKSAWARVPWSRLRKTAVVLLASVACAAIVVARRPVSQAPASSAPSITSQWLADQAAVPTAPAFAAAEQGPPTGVAASNSNGPARAPSPQTRGAPSSSKPPTTGPKPRLAVPPPPSASTMASAPLYSPLAP